MVFAFPDGDTGLVRIHVSKDDALDEKAVKKALAGNKRLKVVAFEKVTGKST